MNDRNAFYIIVTILLAVVLFNGEPDLVDSLNDVLRSHIEKGE